MVRARPSALQSSDVVVRVAKIDGSLEDAIWVDFVLKFLSQTWSFLKVEKWVIFGGLKIVTWCSNFAVLTHVM